jgi:hypothetical protein
MNLRFLPLFTVRVAHGYYAGTCRDFAFSVPARTAALLRGGRMLAREVEGVLHVLYEAGVGAAPLVPATGSTLRIGLQLLNPSFGNITELPPGFPTRRLRHTNAADPRALAPAESFAFVADTFAQALDNPGRPATVTLRDGAGAVLQHDTLAADDGRTALSYDLRGQPTGPLALEAAFPGPVVESLALYRDPELRDAAVVVEVTVDAGFYGSPPALQVTFEPRDDVLSYYVVAAGYTPAEFDSLAVSDQGFAQDGRPEVTFSRIAAADFEATDLPPPLLAPAGERVAIFRSQASLARQERGRSRIQLSKNGDVLMANLPQPGVERAQADLIVHLSKP